MRVPVREGTPVVVATKSSSASKSQARTSISGRGAPQSPSKAAHWYGRAARQGDEGAAYLLASMYEHGHGVPRDLEAARRWYAAAALQRDVAAAAKVKALDAADAL